jgi:hypothetical protein
MMESLPMTTAAQLETRLHEQIFEVATLRLAVDLQSMRIAHIQPELLALPRRRRLLPGLLMRAPSHRGTSRLNDSR